VGSGTDSQDDFPSLISRLVIDHKIIKQLNEYGYIRYEPSFNPAISSKGIIAEH
jgi:hypothetical protein